MPIASGPHHGSRSISDDQKYSHLRKYLKLWPNDVVPCRYSLASSLVFRHQSLYLLKRYLAAAKIDELSVIVATIQEASVEMFDETRHYWLFLC